MQALLDNLAAVVIGATVLLLIAFTQYQSQEAAVDGVQFYAAKSQMVDFARQLQVDLNSLGAGVPNDKIEAGAAIVTPPGSGDTTDVFAFRTYRDSSDFKAKAATAIICYQRSLSGESVHVQSPGTGMYEEKPTFQVIRRVNPSSPATCTGGTVMGASMQSLTAFNIDLRGADGASTSVVADVRQLGVHVRAVSPLGGGTTAHMGGMKQHVDETRWDTVVRPRNLTRHTP